MRKPPPPSRENPAARRKTPGLSLSLGGGWREAMETYGEAVGLAEAGEGAAAREILGEFFAEHRKILVLDGESALPEAMTAYSVNLAERLGFDLVLLSVLSGPRTEAQARAAARPLMEEAARSGVACAQLLRRGRADEVLNAVSLELRRVEFVITRRPESERRAAALLVPEFSLKC